MQCALLLDSSRQSRSSWEPGKSAHVNKAADWPPYALPRSPGLPVVIVAGLVSDMQQPCAARSSRRDESFEGAATRHRVVPESMAL